MFLVKKKDKIKATTEERSKYFETGAMWKVVLKMSLPSILVMFVFGLYSLMDKIFSIQFADDFYSNDAYFSNIISKANMSSISKGGDGFTTGDFIRLSMSGIVPVIGLFNAFTFMISMGTATRVAVNVGRGNLEKSKNTLKIGLNTSVFTSLLLLLIMWFTAKPWIASINPSGGDGVGLNEAIAKASFSYLKVIMPVMFINSISSTLVAVYRIEARIRIIVWSQVIPVFINLFLDWVFMHLLGMGIEGGAIATAVSYGVTFTILFMSLLLDPTDLLCLSGLIGFKLSWTSLIGIFLVGLSPFLRNIAQSLTSSITNSVFISTSEEIFNNDQVLMSINSAVSTIFILGLTSMFGIVQGTRPIISYNYGRGNYDRIKSAVKLTGIYSFIIGTLAMLIIGVGLGHPLLKLLDEDNERAYIAQILSLLALPFISILLAAMAATGSTDRVFTSMFVNLLFGVIVFFPVLFTVSSIAKALPNQEWIIFTVQPVTMLISSFISSFVILHIFRNLENKNKTLDERIQSIYEFLKRKKNK